MVVQRLDDRAGQHDAKPCTGRGESGDDANRAWDLFAWKLVTDDAERQGEHTPADAPGSPEPQS